MTISAQDILDAAFLSSKAYEHNLDPDIGNGWSLLSYVDLGIALEQWNAETNDQDNSPYIFDVENAQALVAKRGTEVALVFRGSESSEGGDFLDAAFHQSDYYSNLAPLAQAFNSYISGQSYSILVTGHSLGAAMAEVYVSQDSAAVYQPKLITFGSPGVNSDARDLPVSVITDDAVHFQNTGDPVTYAQQLVGGGGAVQGQVVKIDLPEFVDGPSVSLPINFSSWVNFALQTEEHALDVYRGAAIAIVGSPLFNAFNQNPSSYQVVVGLIGSGELIGSAEHDFIVGRSRDDILRGGRGNDLIDGGDGTEDTAIFERPFDNYIVQRWGTKVAVTEKAGPEMRDDADILYDVEWLQFVGGKIHFDDPRIAELSAGTAVGSGASDGLATAVGGGSSGTESTIGSPSTGVTKSGDEGPNQLYGTSGPDTFQGNGGNDVLTGYAGQDTFDGGAGSDTVDYSYNPAGVSGTVDLAAGTAFFPGFYTEQLTSIENIWMGAGNDVIVGGTPTTTSVLKPGPEGQDLWITSFFDYNSNYGVDNQELRVGGWGDYYHSLLRFDISGPGLPPHVTSATLRLYNNADEGSSTGMYVDKVQTPWTENYGWYDYTLAATPITTTTAPSLGWLEIDLTTTVNEWLANPSSNNGIRLRPFSNDNNFNEFVSSDATGDLAQFRPELVLSYDGVPVDHDLRGGPGNDVLQGGPGNDVIYGDWKYSDQGGHDTAILSYNFGTGYAVSGSTNALHIVGADGDDWYYNVESFEFAGGAIKTAQEVLGLFSYVPYELGPEFIAQPSAPNSMRYPTIAPLKNGGFAVAWGEGVSSFPFSNLNVWVQLYDANLIPAGPAFPVSDTATSKHMPVITGLDGGGFAVAWLDQANTPALLAGKEIRTRVFDQDGTSLGAETIVAVASGNSSNLLSLESIAGLQGGGFVVAWHQPYISDVIQQTFYDASGTISSLQESASGGETAMAVLTTGKVVIAYWGSDNHIRVQIQNGDGSAFIPNINVNNTTLHAPGIFYHVSVAALDNDEFVVAWGDLPGTRVQKFSSNGTEVGPEVFIPAAEPGVNDNGSPTVCAVTGGGYFVLWDQEDSNENGHSYIYGQQFSSVSAPIGPVLLVTNPGPSPDYQWYPRAITMADGRIVVVWQNIDDQKIHGQTIVAAASNEAPIALGETFSTQEDAPAAANLLADNGNGADTDVDGDTIIVAGINGSASSVNSLITLPSGARLAVNPDGRFVYDPHGAFDSLNGGQTATDTFTYTISDGQGHNDTATVTITINGVDSGLQTTGGPGDETINGTPQDDQIDAAGGNDFVSGGAGYDWLQGGPGDDTLNGQDGSDVLDGGTGADALAGGPGHDIYIVDETGDVVTEALNEGTDLVQTGLAAYALRANVENLTGTLGAGQSLAGNSLDNVITGANGNDIMEGLGGSDTLNGNGGDDVLIGSDGSDNLAGGIGTDALIGLTGTNTMTGGANDDVYYSSSATDVMVELAGVGEGNDVVVSNHSIILAANVERVILTGAATSATGNTSDNLIFGLESSNSLTLDGGDGDDILYGAQQSDILTGGNGADALLGFDGTNTMTGGAGDDTFYSYSATDTINENAGVGEGIDRVISTHDITLSANVENLILLGLATTGIGNAEANDLFGGGSSNGLVLKGMGGADVLTGSAQADLLEGGTGNDFVFGGAGADAFQFTASGFGNDVVTDFVTTVVDGVNHDYVDLRGLNQSFGSLNIVYSGAGATITIGADTIFLSNVTAGLQSSDFLV